MSAVAITPTMPAVAAFPATAETTIFGKLSGLFGEVVIYFARKKLEKDISSFFQAARDYEADNVAHGDQVYKDLLAKSERRLAQFATKYKTDLQELELQLTGMRRLRELARPARPKAPSAGLIQKAIGVLILFIGGAAGLGMLHHIYRFFS